MTTPRIEEMVEQFKRDNVEEDGTMYRRMQQPTEMLLKRLRIQFAQAHQAGKKEGIDEAVKIMESMKEDGETPFGHQELHETELAYNQALDDTIKALQDNK